MSRSDFTKLWYMRTSDTHLIGAKDKLTIMESSPEPAVRFDCESDDPAMAERWKAITDGAWEKWGGPAGHLRGTIKDDGGQRYSLVANHESGDPNWIHLIFLPAGGSGGGVAMSGGGGGGSGTDKPPN